MKNNRESWLFEFQEERFPNWPCPRCNEGVLRPVSKTFHYWESTASHEAGRSFFIASQIDFDDNEMLGMELSKYRYSVLLKCNDCKEYVSSCGSGNVSDDFSPELNDTVLTDFFYPEYFYPTLKIFPIHEKCPKRTARSIRKGSSSKVISGSSGVRIIPFFKSSNPLKESIISPNLSLDK